jgi:hypothetical protein
VTDTLVTEAMAPGNTTGNLRARLYTALAPCLPGRVYAYAPTNQAAVAPALWIAGHDSGAARPLHVVTFHVVAVADGASHAAQAMIDELVSAVASTLPAPFDLVGWSTTDVDVAPDVALPGAVFDISATSATVTFCPPIPYEALTPPEVITP